MVVSLLVLLGVGVSVFYFGCCLSFFGCFFGWGVVNVNNNVEFCSKNDNGYLNRY